METSPKNSYKSHLLVQLDHLKTKIGLFYNTGFLASKNTDQELFSLAININESAKDHHKRWKELEDDYYWNNVALLGFFSDELQLFADFTDKKIDLIKVLEATMDHDMDFFLKIANDSDEKAEQLFTKINFLREACMKLFDFASFISFKDKNIKRETEIRQIVNTVASIFQKEKKEEEIKEKEGKEEEKGYRASLQFLKNVPAPCQMYAEIQEKADVLISFVETEMARLLFLNQQQKQQQQNDLFVIAEAFALAAIFYSEWVAIRPFEQNNGMMGRILVARFLFPFTLTPFSMFLDNRITFINTLQSRFKSPMRPPVELLRYFLECFQKQIEAHQWLFL